MSHINKEALRQLREDREKLHYMHRERRTISPLLELPNALPLPQITLDHCQDSCNKSVMIYWVKAQQCTINLALEFIYKQWFRGHTTDIEFGQFIAKFMPIKGPKTGELTLQDTLGIHKAWCDQLDASAPRFYDPDIMSLSRTFERGGYNINGDQHVYFKVRPLFRSLFMMIDEVVENVEDQIVRLVSTGCTTGLSQPINLVEFESEISGIENSDNLMVTTTLPIAIEFILKLEKRERDAFPDNRDPSVLDKTLGDSEEVNCKARRYFSYNGEEIQGPSTSWVPVSEGDPIVLPTIAVPMPMMRSVGFHDYQRDSEGNIKVWMR